MKITHQDSERPSKTPLSIVFSLSGKRPKLPPGVAVHPGFARDLELETRQRRVTWAAKGPAERVLVIGLGERDKVDPEALRRAGAIAVKEAEKLGVAKATIHLDAATAKLAGGPFAAGGALAEGAIMGAYTFDECKSGAKPRKLEAVTIAGGGAQAKRGIRRGIALAEANTYTRDLQNRPGNKLTPRDMAKAARKLATRSARITCKVLDEKAMERLGMGLLLGVSRGSVEPARLIHLTYKPKGRAKGRVALVGKGLTFDAGGISLKPSSKMDEMRYDMSGGAAVLGVFHALAKIDVPWEVHGIVPSSENLPGGKATKPGDIHTGMNGKTVEILNTDAEGRLILADALAYTEKKIKPDTIIDLATLTGAVVVALGHELSGMFATTEKLRDELTAAGEATGELVWPLPLLDCHKEGMKSESADLKNIASPSMGAGSTSGAAFLASFVGADTEWCHLDIAGAAWGGRNRDWVGGGAGSGVGTRLLVRYLESRS